MLVGAGCGTLVGAGCGTLVGTDNGTAVGAGCGTLVGAGCGMLVSWDVGSGVELLATQSSASSCALALLPSSVIVLPLAHALHALLSL